MIIELAVATKTPPSEWQRWLDDEPAMISTAIAVLEQQADRMKKGGRRG